MLTNKVALITGASRGIGAATAVLLGNQGCKVGVNYHANGEAAEGVVKKIKSTGGEAVAGTVLCLVSDHMSFVSGAYIPVSGGMLMP